MSESYKLYIHVLFDYVLKMSFHLIEIVHKFGIIMCVSSVSHQQSVSGQRRC